MFAPLSDHSAIFLGIQTDDYQKTRGPGFWKFNSSLLRDNKYVEPLRDQISQSKLKYDNIEDKSLKWDLIKMEIRSFTIQYSKRKARAKRTEEKEILNAINTLQKELEKQPQNNVLKHQIDTLKQQLDTILQNKIKGTILRSKARWFEEGERNSKYFLNLEKRNRAQKYITKLKTSPDKVITDASEILKEEKKFYEKLYTSKNPNIDAPDFDEFFRDEHVTKLNEVQKQSCEGDLSAAECLNALKGFRSGRTPGTDGLNTEFYKFFWKELSPCMIESFNHSKKAGKMSIDQRRGIISLLPKKNKKLIFLENWRPVSLLNVDYKIATKAIAIRLGKVLPEIIDRSQTGYVKGRFIGENIRLINDIMYYTLRKNIPGMAIFIDFRKAFDTIEWNFIRKALHSLNFGPNIIEWFNTFYSDISSCTINNGYATAFFDLQRGVRQGCPLSGTLFILCLELLAQNIKHDKRIKGISINNKEVKICQYADDTTCFLKDSESVEQLLHKLELFSRCSGLEINRSKTEALWLGRLKDCKQKPFGFKWPDAPILSLGVYFSYDKLKSDELNFDEKLKKVEKLLNIWRQRDLTLIGKIAVVKSLALAKLIHVASVLPLPENFAQEVNKLIFNFIWNDKPPKIKKATLIGEKRDGGLNAPDFVEIDKALKLTWIKRFLSESEAPWTFSLLESLDKYGGKLLIKSRYSMKLMSLDTLPTFYIKMLQFWQDVRNNEKMDLNCNTVSKELLWNNRCILIAQKTVCYKTWQSKGISVINDLLDENNGFLSFEAFQNKYALTCEFTHYYGLISAIPRQWKQALKQTQKEKNNQNRVWYEDPCLLTTQRIYRNIIRHKFTPPTSQNLLIQRGINEDELHNIYLLPHRLTTETRLITFQIKILHNILPSNTSLFKMKLKDSKSCPYCVAEEQTISHLFIECEQVCDFWKQFKSWWKEKTNKTINLLADQILYGILGSSEKLQLINYLLLIAKYHIFSAYIRNDSFSFGGFLREVDGRHKLEQQIAFKNQNTVHFDRKWNQIFKK